MIEIFQKLEALFALFCLVITSVLLIESAKEGIDYEKNNNILTIFNLLNNHPMYSWMYTYCNTSRYSRILPETKKD